MKDDVRARILENSFALLQPRGRYIQFTYGLLCPVPLKIRRRLGIRARRADVVFDNIPPVTVWVFEHA
jgi:phosphatidylethanolamine/phosphatidyl-N-methylethanolamine N-methyltransferase